jgi:uncharacterized damage-inducible protein DinB
MTPQTAVLMAGYNRWMNRRIYEAACSLPEEDVTKERGAFFGSIFQTLNHIAAGDTIWLHRFSQHADASPLRTRLAQFPQPTSLRQEVAVSLHGLQAYRDHLDDVILQWSQTLTAEQLAVSFTYRNMAGQAHAKNFGHLVQHFFNHQTHHRGQVSTLLFQAGVDIGVTDLLAVIPNEA